MKNFFSRYNARAGAVPVNGGAFRAFLGVSALTFLAKMMIVAKELVVAARYGRRDELDAFLIAFLVPSFIVSIVGNAMTTAVIPAVVRVREKEGKGAARELVAGLSVLTIGVSAAIALLIAAGASFFLPLIASGFSPAKLELTRHLLYVLIPYIFICGILSLWYAVINAEENFAGVVLPPAVTPVLMIVLLLLLPSAGIWSLVAGCLAGPVLELCIAGGILRRAGFSLRPRLRSMSASLWQAAGQFLPSLLGAFLMTSTMVVDQAMAAMLDPGSVAAISYGNKAIGFFLTILSTTFTTLLTPFFSKMMARRSGREVLKPLGQFLLGVGLLAVIFPVLINLTSVWLIKIIFYRGAFTLNDVLLTARVQSMLAWQIPFYICGVILVKFIASMRLNWIQAVTAAINVVVNIGMNYWLMRRMGVAGIALSTSIVHAVSLLSLGVLVYFTVGRGKAGVRETGNEGTEGRGAEEGSPGRQEGADAQGPERPAKKIAHFLPDLRGGGAERTAVNLLRGWAREEAMIQGDEQIDLVLVRAAGVYLKEVPAAVRIIDLNRNRSVGAIRPLARYLKQERPDVLIVHLSHLNIIALLVSKLYSIDTKLVLVEHALLSPERSKGREGIVRWLMKKWYPRAERIVTVSDPVARSLEKELSLPAGKIRTIYNAVIDEDLRRKAAEEVGHPWFRDKDGPVWLGVGRLIPEKGWDTLLEALALLRRERPGRLIILGEGPYRKELEEKVNQLGLMEAVAMPGHVENPYAYMAACDALVSVSWREALPGVVIEALACGCPVIATDGPGGIREVLQDGVLGRLVPVKDAAALAEAMKEVGAGVSDPTGGDAEMIKMARAKRMEWAARFSVERAVKAYRALADEIINQPEKVLHIITGLRTGGAERMLCELLSAMDRQRWDPVVLSLTDGSGPEAALREMGIPVYKLGMRPGSVPLPGLLIRLVRMTRKVKPDLIQGWMYHGNLAASFVRLFLPSGTPVIWNIQHSLHKLEAEKKMTIRTIRAGGWFSRSVDAIIYASQVSRRQHAELGYADSKARVIPNAADPTVFFPSAEKRAAVRTEIGCSGRTVLIGSLARYHPMKDHANFLRAAALLCVQPGMEAVQFLLAGTGVDKDNAALGALIGKGGLEGRVFLLGERSDPDRVLAALDIFCVSSAYGEALPLVLLEAMACEAPAVTTEVGDAGLVVGDTGRVVAPEDPEALAGAWKELVTVGEGVRKALGMAARQKIITHYSLLVCARMYQDLYCSVTR